MFRIIKLLFISVIFFLLPFWGNSQEPETTETPEATAEATEDPILIEYEAAIERARNFTGSLNSDWTPYVHTFPDGIEMVLVPVGCFEMGADPNAYNASTIGVPSGGRVCFDKPFWISQTEISQADFARRYGQAEKDSAFTGENRPVELLTWNEARAFCQLRGGHLPSEAEWEYAARGVESLIFPWGNEFEDDLAIWNRSNSRGTADVGSIPEGASWVGAVDMAGNVWEWTSTLYQDYPYPTDENGIFVNDGRENSMSRDVRVIRGGSWDFTSESSLHAAARSHGFSVTNSFYNVGFRCARRIR